jgi:bifunctional non-homologous end joining protein LigD
VEVIVDDGQTIFNAAVEHGLEGIIAKDLYRTYRSSRSDDWHKVKCIQSESFVIVGYEHSLSARAGIGSLLLAARGGEDWKYVGSVGTGFTERESNSLRGGLDKLKVTTAPIEYAGRRKNIVWVQPILIAEIEYRAWTHDGEAAARVL